MSLTHNILTIWERVSDEQVDEVKSQIKEAYTKQTGRTFPNVILIRVVDTRRCRCRENDGGAAWFEVLSPTKEIMAKGKASKKGGIIFD